MKPKEGRSLFLLVIYHQLDMFVPTEATALKATTLLSQRLSLPESMLDIQQHPKMFGHSKITVNNNSFFASMILQYVFSLDSENNQKKKE